MLTATVVLALAGGSFIFLAFLIAGFFAVVFGYYTITGSGINMHPSDGRGEAPGAGGPSEASGFGRSTGDTREDHNVGDTFSNRGTG